MLEKIEALRRKPQHIRNRYAFWTAFCITFLILVLWGSTLPARFASQETQAPVAEEGGGFGAYKEAFGSLFFKAAETFTSLKKESPDEDFADTQPQRIDFVELVASSSRNESVSASTTSTTTATSSAYATSTTMGE
jgi:hypothetical protein